MKKAKQKKIEKMVKVLEQLDPKSLALVMSGAEILKARQELEKRAG